MQIHNIMHISWVYRLSGWLLAQGWGPGVGWLEGPNLPSFFQEVPLRGTIGSWRMRSRRAANTLHQPTTCQETVQTNEQDRWQERFLVCFLQKSIRHGLVWFIFCLCVILFFVRAQGWFCFCVVWFLWGHKGLCNYFNSLPPCRLPKVRKGGTTGRDK